MQCHTLSYWMRNQTNKNMRVANAAKKLYMNVRSLMCENESYQRLASTHQGSQHHNVSLFQTHWLLSSLSLMGPEQCPLIVFVHFSQTEFWETNQLSAEEQSLNHILSSINRGRALMSSHHSNCCYAAILIGNIDGFLWTSVLAHWTPHASNDPTSSIPFLYRYVNCHD